jgi:hypothetical protein
MKGNGAKPSMKISLVSKYALGILAAAGILAGCSGGGSSPLGPSAMTQNGVTVTHIGKFTQYSYHGVMSTAAIMAVPRTPNAIIASLVPDKHKHKEKIGYVSNFYGEDVYGGVFPKGSSYDTLSGLSDPQGMCAETHRNKFWVTLTGSAEISQYKIGDTTPLKTLSTSSVPGEVVGCSQDPTTGNLAGGMIGAGDVAIFTDATGTPESVSDGLDSTFFVGYDNKGNLFADGDGNSAVELVELPKGSSSFHRVNLPNTIGFPGNVEWDGTYITVNDQLGFAVYRYSVSGSTATLAGTVSYSGAEDCDQDWIFKGKLFCPNIENALVYKYPAGGSPIDTWSFSADEALGSVVVEK